MPLSAPQPQQRNKRTTEQGVPPVPYVPNVPHVPNVLDVPNVRDVPSVLCFLLLATLRAVVVFSEDGMRDVAVRDKLYRTIVIAELLLSDYI